MRTLATFLALCLAGTASAEMKADPVEWTVGGTTFSGYVVHDEAASGPRPGLVMVPNWMGVNASAVEKAKGVAAEGFVVLVADMYGAGLRPANAEEAGQAAGAVYADREGMRARINAALDTLKAQPGVDATRLGAFGFCFGGSTVLELARSGTALGGVVSLHGNLDTSARAAAGDINTPILVLNGADDPLVSAESIAGFEAEMRAAGADWQFVNFGGAVHCFAEADADWPPACLYHAPSARRAYRMMYAFFEEAFASQ